MPHSSFIRILPVTVTFPREKSHLEREPYHAEGSIVDMAACIKQVRQGDEAAASRLVKQLYPLVIKIVRHYRARRVSEEDLAQIVFMKIFHHLAQYAGRVPVEHWASRIAVNTCLNELKAEKVRLEVRWNDLTEDEQSLLNSLASMQTSQTPAKVLAAKDLLEKLLAGLSVQDRLLVQLLYAEELSMAEVKARTGWSIPIIKVRAFRARLRLQKLLDKLMEEVKA